MCHLVNENDSGIPEVQDFAKTAQLVGKKQNSLFKLDKHNQVV